MLGARVRAGLGIIAVGSLAYAAVACSAAAKKSGHQVADAGDYSTDDPSDPDLPPPRPPDYNNPDSDSLGAGERARDASAPKPEGGARAGADEAGVVPVVDAGTSGPTACPSALGPGDLAIVEFMIQSQSGTGDRGEWVEIQNMHDDCTLNLKGLHVESPRGSDSADAVDVDYDISLGPNETFIVADSAVDDVNHALPGTVLSWIATDALKNDGDTITVSAAGTTIDTVTYGDFSSATHIGRTVSFPVDCTWSARGDWSRWSWSFNVWQDAQSGGVPMKGTPNADNDDVACY
jgi:hypothetical protein